MTRRSTITLCGALSQPAACAAHADAGVRRVEPASAIGQHHARRRGRDRRDHRRASGLDARLDTRTGRASTATPNVNRRLRRISRRYLRRRGRRHGDANADLRAHARTLDWMFQDSFGQARPIRSRPDARNTRERQLLHHGPDARHCASASTPRCVCSAAIRSRTTKTARSTPSASSAASRSARELSRAGALSLNAVTEQVEFDDDAGYRLRSRSASSRL